MNAFQRSELIGNILGIACKIQGADVHGCCTVDGFGSCSKFRYKRGGLWLLKSDPLLSVHIAAIQLCEERIAASKVNIYWPVGAFQELRSFFFSAFMPIYADQFELLLLESP